jgi:uncharacterized RDD family membrane protein YckC
MSAPIPEQIRYCAECGRPTPAGELARFGDVLVCANCKQTYAQKLREGAATTGVIVYGGFWIRFVAWLIDSIILGTFGYVLQLAFVGSPFTAIPVEPGVPPSPELMGRLMGTVGLLYLFSVIMAACYEGLFVGKLGATPGKMCFSLKVIRPNDSPVSVARAFGRYFAKLLSGFALLIGYIIAAFDSQKRALHDMICDTRVIRARK